MKIFLISILLLFELCSGLSIQKIKQNRSPSVESATEVYAVEEGDNNTVRLVYPRPEKPVVREIVYYRVTETPYDDEDNVELENEDKEGSLRPEEEDNEKSKELVLMTEQKDARSALFDQARSKYINRRQEKATPKRKREVPHKDLPPGPTLTPLNLGRLPGYVRMLISTVKPEHPTPLRDEDLKKEEQDKIKHMFASLKPNNNGDEDNYEYEYDDSYGYRDDDGTEDGDASNELTPRTYGMNLTMGRGYVWNDLLSEPGMPGMSFEVGKPDDNVQTNREDATEQPDITTTDKPTTAEKPTTIEMPAFTDILTNALHPTESEPISLNNSNFNEASDEIPAKNNKENNGNIGDEAKPDNENHYSDLDDVAIYFTPKQLPINEDDRDGKEERKEDDEVTNEQHKEYNSDGVSHRNSHEAKIKKPINEDVFKELLNNEEFWKWVNDWTATYMEQLMKHIKRLVHDEVARKIKKLTVDLKKDSPPNVKEKTNREGSEMDAKKCSCTYESKEGNAKNEPNLPIHDDNKLFIDGVEIPITHATNFNLNDIKNAENSAKGVSRKHKHPKENAKKPIIENGFNIDDNNKSPITMSAKNIFGNAVASDKVTNIFILHSSDDDDDDDINILSSIMTPMYELNKTTNVKIDIRQPEITGMKDDSTASEPKESIEKPNNNNVKPNDTPNKEDNKIENNHDFENGASTTTQKSEEEKEHDHKTPIKENIDDKKELGKKDKEALATENSSITKIETTTASLADEGQEDAHKQPNEKSDTNVNENKDVTSTTEKSPNDKIEVTTASSDKNGKDDEPQN